MTHQMTGIAVIPARGGSRGVPRKNLAEVGGVRLLERTIRTCQAATRISATIVSSDDLEILAVADAAGAITVLRPAEMARDESPSEPALLHAVSQGITDDCLAFVQCTSPFLRPEQIDACFEALDNKPFAQIAILAAEFHTVFWRGGSDQECLSLPDGAARVRRQDTAPIYLETGACYVYRLAWFFDQGTKISRDVTVLVPAPCWPNIVQIDDPDDLKLARTIADAWGI